MLTPPVATVPVEAVSAVVENEFTLEVSSRSSEMERLPRV